MNINQMIKSSRNKQFIPFLSKGWPGSILNWTDSDLERFNNCLTPHTVKAEKEFSISDPNMFFLVVEGTIEIHAILPTIRKKTDHIREFLCKKDVGDMVYMPSIRALISESNAKDIFDREDGNHKEHKNILNLIDSVTIRSVAPSTTILLLDWTLFDTSFSQTSVHDVSRMQNQQTNEERSTLDVEMLRSIMKTNLSNYLEAIPILEDLPHSKRELLARLCRYSIAKEGSVICKEGSIGDEVYILIHGEVKVETQVSERVLKLFHNYKKEIEDCDSNNTSNNTLQSKEMEVNIKRKASVTYKCDYDPQASKNTSKGMSSLIRLRRTLIQAQDDSKRDNVDASWKESQYRNSLPDLSHVVELSRFGPGDFFGEVSTFVDLPRTATVTATKNCILASLSSTSFKTLYHVITPHLKSDVEYMVKQHMLHSLLQSKSPFLESTTISENHMKKMAERLNIEVLPENTVVFHEGDEADKFYFVYCGQLSVEQMTDKKKKEENVLLTGDYFGEIALIKESKRLATITTKSKTVLLSLTRDNFQECFNDTPTLIAEFVIRMKGKKVTLMDILSYPIMNDLLGEYLTEAKRKEYLDCINDLLAFEKCCKECPSESHVADACRLVETYFKKSGCSPVDISAVVANEVKQLVSDYAEGSLNEAAEYDLFQGVKCAVIEIMENEVIPKFKAWAPFDHVLKRMRAYDHDSIQLLA